MSVVNLDHVEACFDGSDGGGLEGFNDGLDVFFCERFGDGELVVPGFGGGAPDVVRPSTDFFGGGHGAVEPGCDGGGFAALYTYI